MTWDWRPTSRFQRDLIHTHGDDWNVVADEIRRSLRIMRWKAAIKPWVDLFKIVRRFLNDVVDRPWEILYGRHRKPASQVDSGANAAQGNSTGTPVAQGPGYTTVSPSITSSGSGATFATQAASSGLVSSFGQPPSNEPATQPVVHAGIKAGEITAYRCWKLVDGKLRSVYRDYFEWPPGKIVEGDPNNPIGPEGIHGFKNVLSMVEYGFMYAQDNKDRVYVTGTVHLWGDVVEHERGYRAQYAAVVSIDDSPDYDAAALRELYGLTRRKRRKKKTLD